MTAAELMISAASVEIFLFVAGCAVLCADLFLPDSYRARLHWAVIAALLVAAAAVAGSVADAPIAALHGFLFPTRWRQFSKQLHCWRSPGRWHFRAVICSRRECCAANFMRWLCLLLWEWR